MSTSGVRSRGRLLSAILVHVSGINTVIDYAPVIFRSAGWKMDAALFSTFIVGLTNFAFYLDHLPPLTASAASRSISPGPLGMAAALNIADHYLLVGTVSRLDGTRINAGLPALRLPASGPVFWTLVPEIFPNHIRGTAMTVPVLTQWVATWLSFFYFRLLSTALVNLVTFGFLMTMCLLQALFAWRFLPETKNKPLEEIEAFWKRRVAEREPPVPEMK